MARPERFELPTLCFEGRCSIQLSYGRVVEVILNLKHSPPFQKSNTPLSATLLCHNYAKTLVDAQILAQHACHFVGLAVESFQGFPFHLQLHLPILLEDLGIT